MELDRERVNKVFVEWLTRYIDNPDGFQPDPSDKKEIPEVAAESTEFFMKLWEQVGG